MGELRRDIEEEQRMLLHFQEQKMALAVQCYDLVDTHVQNLGRNMDGLREELEVRGGCFTVQLQAQDDRSDLRLRMG